mmetsp:Transcript_17017/g.25306  ORF Transcript_17017/g.25306 Transcript_17017/m.25306 type:complete len:158 (-) Transcript_17017:1363-1836(-)
MEERSNEVASAVTMPTSTTGNDISGVHVQSTVKQLKQESTSEVNNNNHEQQQQQQQEEVAVSITHYRIDIPHPCWRRDFFFTARGASKTAQKQQGELSSCCTLRCTRIIHHHHPIQSNNTIQNNPIQYNTVQYSAFSTNSHKSIVQQQYDIHTAGHQ